MDGKKGNNRSVQAAPKGLASSDAKKIQDGASGKPWPRGGRRREPVGGTPPTKNEPASRSKPTNGCNQRSGKSSDKRPRPRGGPPNYNAPLPASRTEEAGLDDVAEAEWGSVNFPGSKKQSLNHLLNFQYASHGSEEGRYFHSGRFTGYKGNKSSPGKHSKYNKEHFLRNNCQFIVNKSGDYKQCMVNPDALVDWNTIEQLNVQVTEQPRCPICLSKPTAAKITRCGHVYCWSCILHYLALSDKDCRKCPICYEPSLNKKDLKSVVNIPHHTFKSKDTITFKLMKRSKGSLVAYPATASMKDDTMFTMSDKEADSCYAKLLLANDADIMSIIQREYRELMEQKAANEGCPESCFIEEALTLLEDRKRMIDGGCLSEMQVNNTLISSLGNIGMDDNNSSSSKDSIVEVGSTITQDISANIGQASPKIHYFYQASDGQHIYLHGINAKMLEHTYGSLEHGPKTLSGKILEKEEYVLTEQLRNKFRYLQHLPITCPFECAEIELKEPIVDRNTLLEFKGKIDGRHRERQKRDKQEKQREKRITAELNRQLGKYPTPNLHIESVTQFPGFEPRARTESESTQPSECGSMIEDVNNIPIVGASFAKVASTSRAEPNQWPVLVSSLPPTDAPLWIRSPQKDAPPSPTMETSNEVHCTKYDKNETKVQNKKKKKKNKGVLVYSNNVSFYEK